jgi:hypothetical protein
MDDPLGAACSKRPGSAMGRPAVLILGAFMTQTGSSGDLWHLNENIETGPQPAGGHQFGAQLNRTHLPLSGHAS